MKHTTVDSAKAANMLPGVTRKTLAYNKQMMLCHIELKKGATIPLHQHEAAQIGIVSSGKVRFFGEKPDDQRIVGSGGGYVMDGNQPHGAEALEDAILIESFSPSRPEYEDII